MNLLTTNLWPTAMTQSSYSASVVEKSTRKVKSIRMISCTTKIEMVRTKRKTERSEIAIYQFDSSKDNEIHPVADPRKPTHRT